MGLITDTDDIVIDRNYSDNFSIKKTAMEKLGPKYFEDVDLSGLNVGALGFVLEQIANITEDSFNTTSLLFNEAFPNKCTIPESIYTHAAIFQLDKYFCNCASCDFIMLVQQSDVLQYGKTNGSLIEFYLDKRTTFTIEGIPFTLDYDIKITAQRKVISGTEVDYNFSAQYVIDSDNSISSVNDPYLKIRKTSTGHLILMFTAHQVERIEITDNIISNTKINYPTLNYEFEGQLAGFDIFYKEPSATKYTQLTKKIMFSLPIKSPFCYYRLKDENILSISFTSKDGYFQPEFNSEIKIVLYTTLGTEGNFDEYSGSTIEIGVYTDKYEYNELMTTTVKPVSASVGGSDSYSLEALQALTVESYSTATELSTEFDIQRYFYDFKYRYNNEILVIKRRDDVTERLLSAFLLLKKDEYIYPTNTLFIDLKEDDFDEVDKGRYSLKPGHLFVYKQNSMDTVELIDGMSYDDNISDIMDQHPFVYTNPFLISVTTSPNIIGLYQTIINKTSILDYVESNADAFYQFVTSKVNLVRNLDANSEYDLSLSIIPASSTDAYIDSFGRNTNIVRVIAGFVGKGGAEVGYVELLPTGVSETDESAVTFSTKLKTNDTITSTGLLPILNAEKVDPLSDYMYIPITDVTVNIYIYYKDENGAKHPSEMDNYFTGLDDYMLTNTYTTKGDTMTFIEPLNLMRSTVIFSNVGTDSDPVLNVNLSLIPMVKADIITDQTEFEEFVKNVTNNYKYIETCLPRLRNNTNIDIKFYNSYGKSKNYFIGDSMELIDKVNIDLKFSIIIVNGADDVEVKSKVKAFIKQFVETINTSGTNDLYISNLIREIEKNFAEVHHMKFNGINDYDTDYQTISAKVSSLDDLTKNERRRYVPEILVADTKNVMLSVLDSNN